MLNTLYKGRHFFNVGISSSVNEGKKMGIPDVEGLFKMLTYAGSLVGEHEQRSPIEMLW